ncbi:MAG: hypothetical protein WA759_04940, partial [Pseudolabrys sp.]
PNDRGSDQDQSRQESGFPCRKRPEDGDLNVASLFDCKAPLLAGGVFICHTGQLPIPEQSHSL